MNDLTMCGDSRVDDTKGDGDRVKNDCLLSAKK